MVDVCDAGCGMWLDTGELELLAEREKDSWLSRLIGSRS
jgi:Zn-finger nucleic acid-binding protein